VPNGKTHKYVGVTAGLGLAAYQAKGQKGLDFWMEVFGGAVGGWPGAKLPDIFEPAISSYHRGVAHSITTGTVIVSQIPRLSEFVNYCREQAEQCKANPRRVLLIPVEGGVLPIELSPGVGDFLSGIEQLLWRFLAGFLYGAFAGYVSHLALDGVVGKRSIPLIMKSC
jgi:hypothetical protein